MDQWVSQIDWLRQYSERRDGGDPDRDALFDHLRELSIDVGEFRYLHRDLGAVEIQASSDDGKDWKARLTGPRLAGSGRLRLESTPARYDFDMTRLHWPRLQKRARATTYEATKDPSEFAHLSITAEDFRFGDMRLGALALQAGPADGDWVLSLVPSGVD